MKRRSRVIYLTLAAGLVILGLASRSFRSELPSVLAAYAGDTLWAAMIYLLAAALWNKASPKRLALGVISFSLAIELSQLYHADWINSVRATRLGALVLGQGFLWSDLVCYAVGVTLALAIDRRLQRPTGSTNLT